MIGPSDPQRSYLVADHYLEIAKQASVDAVHPGYGFLSENADFVERLEQAGYNFVGPPASAIRSMGSKSEAKTIMENAGVPILPGFHGAESNPTILLAESKRIGFPVLLKASLGGGGKGMRIVQTEADFDEALEAAQREAMRAFGNDHMIVEKFVTNPRHIELQIFGDKHGNYIHMNERDCSI